MLPKYNQLNRARFHPGNVSMSTHACTERFVDGARLCECMLQSTIKWLYYTVRMRDCHLSQGCNGLSSQATF